MLSKTDNISTLAFAGGIVAAGMSGPVSILSTYLLLAYDIFTYYTDNIGIKQYITQIS